MVLPPTAPLTTATMLPTKRSKRFNRQLIQLVQEQPVLWQTKQRKWTPNLNLDEIWSRIGTQLCCSGTEAKTKWQKWLRKTYVRYRRKILSAPTPEESAKVRASIQWPYFDSLSFLEGHVDNAVEHERTDETDRAINGILTTSISPSNGLQDDDDSDSDSSLPENQPENLQPRTVNIRDHEEHTTISPEADAATFSQILENLQVTPIDSAKTPVTPAEIEAIRKRRLREAMAKIREKKAILQEDRSIKQLLTQMVSLQTRTAEDTRTNQAKWLLSYEHLLISAGSRYELKIRAKVNAAFEEVLAEKAAQERSILQQSVDCILISGETQ